VLKKLFFPAVVIYTIALTTVCLATLKNVPDIGVSFGDKIFHFLAYFVLAILWFCTFFYNFNLKKRRAIIYSAIISISFGILIEVLQETLTSSRALDVYDIVANTSGVMLAVIFIVFKR